jgi:hypothetical protein
MAVCQTEQTTRTNRVLVCGGRDFADAEWMSRVLGAFHKALPIEVIIHGDARGADRMAGQWAKRQGIPVEVYPADWQRHGRAAGAIRNQQMLDEGKPDHVFAFAGGRGTADMLRRAKAANLSWSHHSRDAIATEARRAGTGNTDPVHEGAGRDSGIAQNTSGPSA